MSAFGDKTVKQDILESLEAVRDEHGISLLNFLQALHEVIVYMLMYRLDDN